MDSAALLITFLAVYLCFISLLFFTIIFGSARRHEGGCLGHVYNFFTVSVVQKGYAWAGKLLFPKAEDPGVRLGQVFERMWYYFEKYVMSAVYIGLLAGGLLTANRNIIVRLSELDALDPPSVPCPRSKVFCLDPEGVFTIPPRTNPEAIYAYGFLAIVSWLAVYLSNPGIVNSDTIADMDALYPCDEVIFVSGRECTTCKQPRLPRSKHDSLVGACIARYDHFCGWTGNAIGLYNTNRFCVFLLVHLTMLVHGAALAAELIYARMLMLIDGQYMYVSTGDLIREFSVVIAFAAEPTLCLFLFVLVVTIFVVGGFLFYHVSLISRNTTSYEAFKWSPVIKSCADYKKEHGRSYGDMLSEIAVKESLQNGTPTPYVPKFHADGLPVNVYDRGLLNNALEVLFPGWFVQAAKNRRRASERKSE